MALTRANRQRQLSHPGGMPIGVNKAGFNHFIHFVDLGSPGQFFTVDEIVGEIETDRPSDERVTVICRPLVKVVEQEEPLDIAGQGAMGRGLEGLTTQFIATVRRDPPRQLAEVEAGK